MQILIHFLFFILLYHIMTSSSLSIAKNHLCRDDQSNALLQFKQSITVNASASRRCEIFGLPSSSKTESWNMTTDCCRWDGVTCDNLTGRVIGLHLRCSHLQGVIDSNSSLFQLSHLKILRLALNDFSSSELPEPIGNLKSLSMLDLSFCHFWGSIPESLGNLTRLTHLSLAANNFAGPIPSTLSGLEQLELLDISGNALRGQIPNSWGNFRSLAILTLSKNFLTGPFPSSFTNLTQLWGLNLSNNSLSGPIPPVHVLGFPNLTFLSLEQNSFNGTTPSWLFSLPSLRYLSLSSNELTGKISDFQSHSLESIDLSENKLYGPIPNSLFKLNNLSNLAISYNNFRGDIDISMFSNMEKLWYLDLSFNNLSLTNNEINTTMPESLTYLLLSSCSITNLDFLRGARNLDGINLSNNMLHGQLPKWMTYNFRKLYSLYLSNNFLTSMNHLPQGLSSLDLSSNLLQGPLLIPDVTITFFSASNNNLSGEIPSLICNLSILDFINLSNNSLTGVIPQCLGNGSSKLTVLDFHMNRLQGKIPDAFGVGSSLRSLNLRDNQLEGTVPKSLSNCRELEVLDLRNNFLNGTFPSWLGILPKLQVLSLRSNYFYGPISIFSSNRPEFSALKIIDLSHNQFSGILAPRFFRNLEGMKRVDTSLSKVYIGNSYYYDSVVIIIKGLEIQLVRILSVLTTIDLSNNKFEGEISYEIGELLALRGLNLSHNIFEGEIPAAFGNLTVLESLDLSSNKLDGGIPQQLKTVTSLAVLNLSENHLVGSIPQGNQFATFKNESYIGNSGLCGFPLSKSCEYEGLPKSSPPVSYDENYEGFFDGFTWQSVLTGYGVGMGIGVGAASLMFFTGKPKWFSEFVKKHGFKRRRRRVEIKRNF